MVFAIANVGLSIHTPNLPAPSHGIEIVAKLAICSFGGPLQMSAIKIIDVRGTGYLQIE